MSTTPKVFEKPTLSGPILNASGDYEDEDIEICVSKKGCDCFVWINCEWGFYVGGAIVGVATAAVAPEAITAAAIA